MKRFTETNKWQDPWFRRLPPVLKCLWNYICDNCDAAGVIEFDPEHASFCIGETVTFDDLGQFGERLQEISTDRQRKWHIIKFLKFQYVSLSRESPAHRPVFTALERHGLCPPDDLIKSIPYPTPAPKGRVLNTLRETVSDRAKDTDKDKAKDTGKATPGSRAYVITQALKAIEDRIAVIENSRPGQHCPYPSGLRKELTELVSKRKKLNEELISLA